jgi:hypothetical protein
LRPTYSDFGQNLKPRTEEIPLLFSNGPKESQEIHTPLSLINQASYTGEHVEIR